MSTRKIALAALSNIFAGSDKPKEALDRLSQNLDNRDKAFLMEMVYGVLRHRDSLDWVLGSFLQRPSDLPDGTINNLRIAMYQLRFMRVPQWAAVNEAVEVEKTVGRKAALVNAVLRNYLRRSKEIRDPDGSDIVRKISIMTSHPAWMVKRWIERLGPDETLKLAQSNNDIPPITLRIDGDRKEALRLLDENGIEAVPTEYSHSGIVIQGTRKAADEPGDSEYRRIAPQHIPLDVSGYVIQDEAAQLVGYLLGPHPGERVLDACAAPGGKTTHIARLMQDTGEVVAVDVDAGRLRKLEENVSRLGLRSVKIVHGDIRCGAVEGLFDKILLDAPCSSIGVVRRNPDVKYRHTESDLGRLQILQTDLLEGTVRYLKPGGIMVYSVCSTEPEEGEEVVRNFLHSHADFSIIEGACTFLDHFAFRDDKGRLYYRTWPHRHRMDGFFAVRFTRVS
ncbi:MAG TPA: 16S rRNA (cytosine(967)-C(5))-methyltransferase RsmB [Dissulfurispiraceae bacterium]|nr:16S rRNA (cytosine(967)-C(5))-methyltransferase RsmB [Dissulfurispiraceae bacterium]